MISKSYGEHRAQTATPTVTLVERPEQALFHLSVSVETDSASAAVPLLKRAATRLEEVQLFLAVEGVAEVALR